MFHNVISVALWHSSKAADSVRHDKVLHTMVITSNAPEIYNKTAEKQTLILRGGSNGLVNTTSFEHYAVLYVAETKKADKHVYVHIFAAWLLIYLKQVYASLTFTTQLN